MYLLKKENVVDVQEKERLNVDKNLILSFLKRIRTLFTYAVDCPDKLLRDLAAIVPSKHMIFPCDIIDLRNFLITDRIVSSNPICLFSNQFAEKYLKDYSLFLVLDAGKIEVENYKYGGLQVNFCKELDITKLIVRIIVNEPAAAGSFNDIKDMVQEFGLGVECLVSNSVPGISFPNKRLAHRIASKQSELSLTPKEKNIFEFLRQVKKDNGLNIQMRVAGGWVRDKLLGQESDDIDIAINMPGYDFAKLVAKAAVENNITNDPKAYRVSLEKSANPDDIGMANDDLMVGAVNLFGQKIEFVPMRTEHYPDPNSRQPQITTTDDPMEDVKRRDLTINAIYYNIDTGQVDDYVGGIKDLGLEGEGKMILRTPDETKKTYMEDPLRLLRALRFHSRYPNSILDPKIVESMSDPAIQEAYTKKVATERAGPEIMKMMAGDPVNSLRVLFESGLYKTVFKVPEMENLNEEGIQMDQKTPWHKHNLMNHILEVIKNVNQISRDNGDDDYKRSLMNLAGLFHDFGKMKKGIQKPHPKNEGQMQYINHEKASHKMSDAILKSIGVGKDDRDIVNQIVRLHMRPHGANEWGPKAIGKFIRETVMHGKEEEHKDLVEDILRFNKADEMSSNPDNFNEEEWQSKYDKIMNFRNSPSGSFRGTVLNGNDVMALFPQLKPSGYIKEVLDYVKELQDTNQVDMSGDINVAKQQAIEFVQQMAPQIIEKYKEDRMGSNWFKKVKVSQVAPLEGVQTCEDPEIKKGPKKAIPKYERGMRVRDRRNSVSQNQTYGKVESIKGDKVKIVWNPDDKEKRKEEIFDMVENTEILSLIVAEV